MLRQPPSAELRELAERAAASIRRILGGETRVYWFGSWIWGTPVSRSDIDLAVDIGRPLQPEEVTRLRDELDTLPTLRGIDLVDLHGLSQDRRKLIVEEGMEL